MQDIAELIKAVASLLWVAAAISALLMIRSVVSARGSSLTKLGLGPTGVSMEFAESKIEEAISGSDEDTRLLSVMQRNDRSLTAPT